MTEKRVSVRIAAVGGEQMKAQFAEVGAQGERAMQRIGQGATRMGPAVQNAAFQIGDFAVQVAAGTSPARAMAQQLPQLLGGFGVAGAVIGAASAALVPFIGSMFEGVDRSKALQNAMGDLQASLKDYEGYAETAAKSTAELVKQFGGFAGQVKGFSEYMAQLKQAEFFENQKVAVEALRGGLTGVIEMMDAYRLAEKAANDRSITTPAAARLGMEVIRRDAEDLAGAIGLTADQAEQLAAALDGVSAAETFNDTAVAAGEALAILEQIYPVASQMPEPLREAYEALGKMAEKAAAAATSATDLKGLVEGILSGVDSIAGTDLSGVFANAVPAATSLLEKARGIAAALGRYAAGVANGTVDPTPFGPGQTTGTPLFAQGMYGSTLGLDLLPPEVRAPRGGGGGGRSVASEMAREAKKVFEDTRSAAERYAMELENLNELYKAGAIDADTFERAQQRLKERFGEQGGMLKEIASEVRGSLSGVFRTVVDGGDEAIAKLGDLGRELAAMVLEQQMFAFLAKLAPNIFGAGGTIPLVKSAMGNAFDGGRVIPFAAGGIVTGPSVFPLRGATGLMGEAGPEAILPLTRIGGRLGVAAAGGGGTVVQVIDQRRGGAAVRTEESRGPDGREMVRVFVADELARGGFDRPMSGRYGAKPQPVRR